MFLPPTATPEAFDRLCEINDGSDEPTSKCLRVAVLGGGCSGFQYSITLCEAPDPGDHAIEGKGQAILVDEVSLPFLAGAVIHFEEGLAGSRFVVKNPNAVASCGCGTSFSI